jgi:hypothetical protein
LFKGTELIVAGKLKVPENNFNSTLNADSMEGNFEGPIIVTCFDFPIIPPVSVPQQRRIGHLEKLWAYLNIQQLMDQYELNKNENSTERARALKLALEYSFVTPLTSLVVVKPNDTTTSAGPEKIKPLSERYNFGSLMASPGFQSGYSPPLMAHSFAASSYMTPISLKIHSGTNAVAMSQVPEFSTQEQYVELETNDKTIIKSAVDSSQKVDYANSTLLHDINEITWLNLSNTMQPSITLNETNSVYQVLLNTTDQTYQNCTTPDSVQGNCKHLKDCVLNSILNSFDVYIPLFCPIENIYAGICCF